MAACFKINCLTGDGILYLPVVLPLMYRMAELYGAPISGYGVDEDEGLGLHSVPLPRLLCQVLNMLSSFQQANKVPAEMVILIEVQAWTEMFDRRHN